VEGASYKNGYRFAITFANPNPLPLLVPDISYTKDAGCKAFVPSDTLVDLPPPLSLDFRYRVQPGPALVLTVKPNVTLSSTVYSIRIPKEEGVEAPILGALAGENHVIVSVVSKDVSMTETVVTYREIPWFAASALTFDEAARAGSVSSVKIAFQLNVNISSGDQFNVSLPGFSGPAGLNRLALNGSHATSFDGTWRAGATSIHLVALHHIRAYAVVQLEVPVMNRLRIPWSGVQEDSRDMLIAYSGVVGKVDPHPVRTTQPIGVAYSEISYTSGQANAACNITFLFSISHDLLPGDTVRARSL